MEFKDIEFKKVKTYKVGKEVKLALLEGVIVRDGTPPEIPASNAIKAEQVLILGMTNLTQKELDEFSEEDITKVLTKINDVATNPSKSSVK